MRSFPILLLSVVLAACSPSNQPDVVDAGPALTADALVGRWEYRRHWMPYGDLVFTQTFRADGTMTLGVEAYAPLHCPATYLAYTSTGDRTWRVEGNTIVFGSMNCTTTPAATCPGYPVTESGCEESAEHTAPASLTAPNTLVLGMDGVNEGGTYTKQ